MRLVVPLVIASACSGAHHASGTLPDAPGGTTPDAGTMTDAPGGELCASVTDTTPIAIATADHAAEYTLTVTANSSSATSWGTAGDEAVVLEVSGGTRGFIGHVVL